jgi:PAS domain S-box-containing protein
MRTAVLLLAVLYYFGGLAGHASIFVQEKAALVWPPAGIALGAILLFGYRYWPGVALGSVLFSLMTGEASWVVMICTMVGNTVGALLCAYLLERFVNFQNSMERVRDVAGFVVLACVLGTTFNAACGGVGACYIGGGSWDNFLSELLKRWIPNAMACLVVAPVILSLGTPSFIEWKWPLRVEGIICGIGLTLGTLISFDSWYVYGLQSYPLAYLPYPFLVWGALRLGQRGATVSTMVVATLAISASLKQQGPFAAPSEGLTFIMVGTYLGILALTNMLLAAAATERRMAEDAARKSEAMFLLISENVGDLIAVTDAKGKRLYNSPYYSKVLGYGRNLAGTDAFAEIHPEEREKVKRAFEQTIQTGIGQRLEYRFVLPDGSVRYIESLGNYVRGERGQPGKVVSISRDITEHKKIEADLAQARDEALTAARQKTEFLANMSHEIRTPMNGIIGMSSLLMRTQLSSQQLDYARTISNSCQALLGIINDILDLSKIEAGKLRLEAVDFDLCETVDDVLHLLADRAREKGLELAASLAPEMPTRFRGDPTRLRQILTNLVGNAIKFTDSGEVIVRVFLKNASRPAAGRPVRSLGHRRGDCAGGTIAALSTVQPGRQLHHAKVWWHGVGPGDLPPTGHQDGWRNRLGKRTWQRLEVLVCHSTGNAQQPARSGRIAGQHHRRVARPDRG